MMDEIIIYRDELPELSADASRKIAEFEKSIKELKKKEEDLKARIKEAMEENGCIRLENDILSVAYVESYEKESLDAKRLKEELPDIYDAYVKMSTVKPSVRITTKC